MSIVVITQFSCLSSKLLAEYIRNLLEESIPNLLFIMIPNSLGI